jgi:hypothetical protein
LGRVKRAVESSIWHSRSASLSESYRCLLWDNWILPRSR